MSQINATVTTYEPDNSIRKGYLFTMKEIITEFRDSRWLTYQFFKRDLAAMYKQSFIGIMWIFILPIVNVATFFMLSRSGILNVGKIDVPYPIYAILGIAFWQIFATGIITCGTALTNAGEMITRINFSKKSLVVACMGKPLVSFFIQFMLVGILFILYKIPPNTMILLIPLVITPLILWTLGLGFIAAFLNAIVRDTGNLLTIAMTLFMYLTPVLYAKPTKGLLLSVTQYNPMYYLVSAGRDLVLTGKISDPQGFLYSSILSIFIFVIAITVFHLAEPRIAERV